MSPEVQHQKNSSARTSSPFDHFCILLSLSSITFCLLYCYFLISYLSKYTHTHTHIVLISSPPFHSVFKNPPNAFSMFSIYLKTTFKQAIQNWHNTHIARQSATRKLKPSNIIIDLNIIGPPSPPTPPKKKEKNYT